MIPISKTEHKKTWQTCSFFGCTIRYYGIKNKKYCDDKRCQELRKAGVKTKGRKKTLEPNVKNIILSKARYSKHINKGQALKIRCGAVNVLKERCSNTFLITYDPKQNIYPRFCEGHRSAYKRQRFQERKECQS